MSRRNKAGLRGIVPQREPREPVPQASTPRGTAWLVPVLIALLTVAAFLPTLRNEFVNWDDDKNFLDNPQYRGLGWPQLRWMFTAVHMGHYVPLTWLTLGLDYALWGMKPFGYHLTSLLLHAANAVVFCFVARRLLGLALPGPARRGQTGLAASAAFAALVFAPHPLRVESVAWATERRDVLSGLFYLLTILVYLRTLERGERGCGGYWTSVALFACALLSKSMAVSLPVVLLILDVYPLRRLGGRIGWWSTPARRVYLEKIPFVLLALATSAVAFLGLARTKNLASLGELSVVERLATSGFGLASYLGKMVAPVSLSPLYGLSWVNPSAPPFLMSYGAVLALSALALGLRGRVPWLLAAWLAYVATLLPVLGIFQNGPQIAADRYSYLAGLGAALLAGAALLSCWRLSSFLVTGVAVCILFGLGALTWNQVKVWHDSVALWTHALAVDPESPIAHNNLGQALARQSKVAEAIEHFQKAVQLKPGYAGAHNNWGAALVRQGMLSEAIEHFEHALRITPNHPDAHDNWGLAQAMRVTPDYADAHNNWGAALAQRGQLTEAIDHYQKALRLKPDHHVAHYNWGNALAQQGELAEAIEHFSHALRITPDYADAHNNWGLALAQQGRLSEAIEHYQQALRVTPDHSTAHYNWGNALGQQGNPAEAIEHFRQAVGITPDYPKAHNNWGLALVQQDKMAEAIEHFRQALRIAPDFTPAQSNLAKALRGLGGADADASASRKPKQRE